MKTTLKFRLVIIFCLLISFGCSKDSMEEERFEGTMQAKVNGELVTFKSATGDGSFNMDADCIMPFHRIFGR